MTLPMLEISMNRCKMLILRISITSIYADGGDVGSSASNVASSAGLDYTPVHETSVGKQRDWVATVQETYESTEVADGLWVVPKWRTPPMGAALSTGIDIDRQAVTSASENLLLNGLRSDQMPVYLVTSAQPSYFPNIINKSEGDKDNIHLQSSRGSHDIVAANILLNPLLELVEDLLVMQNLVE